VDMPIADSRNSLSLRMISDLPKNRVKSTEEVDRGWIIGTIN